MRSTRRMPARLFYGIILLGVLAGSVIAATAGWVYLEFGERKPTGRRVWDAAASEFVIPICVMIGATFGGLAGVAGAAIGDRYARSRS